MEKLLNDIVSRLDRIEQLLQPKKKTKQVKIADTRTLEDQIQPLRGRYAPGMIEDFLNYWNEGNRWKKEKVWDINLRLQRWKRIEDKRQYEKEARQQLKMVDELPVHRAERVTVNSGFSSISSLLPR